VSLLIKQDIFLSLEKQTERDRQTDRKGRENILQGKQLNTTQHNSWHFQKQDIKHTVSNDILKKCGRVTQIYSDEDEPCHPAMQ